MAVTATRLFSIVSRWAAAEQFRVLLPTNLSGERPTTTQTTKIKSNKKINLKNTHAHTSFRNWEREKKEKMVRKIENKRSLLFRPIDTAHCAVAGATPTFFQLIGDRGGYSLLVISQKKKAEAVEGNFLATTALLFWFFRKKYFCEIFPLIVWTIRVEINIIQAPSAVRFGVFVRRWVDIVLKGYCLVRFSWVVCGF